MSMCQFLWDNIGINEMMLQIESVSKHSRTTSHSEVYEKSTKVTKTSKVGDLCISEQDEIITKEKVSLPLVDCD